MAEQEQEEAEAMYVEHQYMCSECHQLFNTLEDVLIHQQIHTGQEVDGEAGEALHTLEMGQSQQYQCLECGSILVNAEELLQHQEMHIREAGMQVEQQELSEVLHTETADSEAEVSGPVKYQCLDCLALFDSPETWLEHRRTHNRSSTHSNSETAEYVLQPDGSITPLNTQNYVLSEQQAGEILAQVLAQQQQQQQQQQQKKRQSSSKSAAASHSYLLPPVTPAPGSATMHLQILTAQALADSSTTSSQRRSKLPPLLPNVGRSSSAKLEVLENGVQRVELRLAPSVDDYSQQQQTTELVVIHPYECSECSLLFQTPEDFLQHQGEHFLGQDKESGEPGVMSGLEEMRGREEATNKVEDMRNRAAEKKAVAWVKPLQCELCNRTFTSVNRLAAHKRVHELGTHECPDCGKVFKKATSLQTHMRSHSGVARYLCVDCGNGFTTEMTLIMHRKSHTADPLHKCQFCNKTFTNMTKYLYHRRTHLNRDAYSTPPVFVASPPKRTSATALTILQRARERNSHTDYAKTNLMAPLTEEEMETLEDPSQSSPNEMEAGDHGKEKEGSKTAPSDTPEITTEDLKDITASVSNPSSDESGAGVMSSLAGSAEVASTSSSEKALFRCRSCPKTFPSQLQLMQHWRKSHVIERRFICGICGKSFKKHVHVRNHIRTHTGEKPFQCSDCGKTFSSLGNLMRHTLIHSGVRPYRCDVCHRSFSQSSNLRQHSLLHSSAATLSCPDCPATFRWATKLAAHRFTHHPGAPAPFPCPHCEEGFLTRKQRDSHCLEQHPTLIQDGTRIEVPKEAHNVAVVGKDLVSEPSTSKAMTESGDLSSLAKGALECNICGKKLNSPANLRLHKLSHFALGLGRPRCTPGKRPKAHQCPICGKLFVSSSGVALHQRVHTGERPFPCQVCGKRFRQNTHLREHLRTHSGERPFRCEVCGKGFIQSMHLAEHRRTHTGERPHACPLCGKAFKTFSNLRNHKKTHARQQRLDEEAAAQVAAQAAMEASSAVAVVDASAVDLANKHTQLIQIQASDLQQGQGTPTIMCNEFGETIAIIETSEGGVLPLEQALEIYHTALENGLTMETVAVDRVQLL